MTFLLHMVARVSYVYLLYHKVTTLFSPTILTSLLTSVNNYKFLNSLAQRRFTPRHKFGPISMWHSHQTRRVHVALYRMTIDIIVLFDFETVQEANEREVQFPICKNRSSAHSVPKTVGEHRCIWLFEPTFRAERFGVGPDF